MRLAILTDYYASVQKPDARAFIHARARLYTELGHEVLVLSPPQAGLLHYDEFEGIRVVRPVDFGEAQSLLETFSPGAIAIHFPYRGTFVTKLAAVVKDDYPLVAWLHGYEALYTVFLVPPGD